MFRYFDKVVDELNNDALNYDENGDETKHKRKYKWSLDDLDGYHSLSNTFTFLHNFWFFFTFFLKVFL